MRSCVVIGPITMTFPAVAADATRQPHLPGAVFRRIHRLGARDFHDQIRVASKQELKDRIITAIDDINHDLVVHTWN